MADEGFKRKTCLQINLYQHTGADFGIAQCTTNMIEPNDTVFLGGETTSAFPQFCRYPSLPCHNDTIRPKNTTIERKERSCSMPNF